MPNVQLRCRECGYTAKRKLLEQAGCRGIHETACEPASCPKGHGELERVDGTIQAVFDGVRVVVGDRRRARAPIADFRRLGVIRHL